MKKRQISSNKKVNITIDEFLTRGVEKIYPSKQALQKALSSGRKLKMYMGIDPTGERLHIGHTVALWKLRQFQELGHQSILLIGDFTGMIGDPSGKLKSRGGVRSRKEVLSNAKTYKQQAAKILNFRGNNPVQVKYNSQWLNKLSLQDWLKICANFTLQQLEERDMFVERKKKGEPILFSEFQYPLLQAYDFVVLDADIQIGGTDQTFNMLIGRTLNRLLKRKEVFVITVPLLADASGRKIGKTEGNVIAITDSPNQLYGKIMSLPDTAILPCFELITPLPLKEVGKIRKQLEKADVNPMDLKKKLAYNLVALYHSEKAAEEAEKYFETVFQKQKLPEKLPIYRIKPAKRPIVLIDFLVKSKLVSSKSQAKRLIKQKAVQVDGKNITKTDFTFVPKDGTIIKVGKRRFLKISIYQS